MTKTKMKYKVNDVLLLKEQNKAAIIDSVVDMNKKGHLYTLKVIGEDSSYKRYYEGRIDNECSKIKNDKAVKVLYGTATSRKTKKG